MKLPDLTIGVSSQDIFTAKAVQPTSILAFSCISEKSFIHA